VDFLGIFLDALPVIHDADAPIHLPGNAISPAAPQKEICRRRDHKRGVRGTAGQAPARCECEIAMFPLDPAATDERKSVNPRSCLIDRSEPKQNISQELKPADSAVFFGPAEAVPFYKAIYETSSSVLWVTDCMVVDQRIMGADHSANSCTTCFTIIRSSAGGMTRTLTGEFSAEIKPAP